MYLILYAFKANLVVAQGVISQMDMIHFSILRHGCSKMD